MTKKRNTLHWVRASATSSLQVEPGLMPSSYHTLKPWSRRWVISGIQILHLRGHNSQKRRVHRRCMLERVVPYMVRRAVTFAKDAPKRVAKSILVFTAFREHGLRTIDIRLTSGSVLPVGCLKQAGDCLMDIHPATIPSGLGCTFINIFETTYVLKLERVQF